MGLFASRQAPEPAPLPKSSDGPTLSKTLFVGDGGVGKTSMLMRLRGDDFSGDFITTIGIDFHLLRSEVAGQELKLQLWDTGGRERFRSITTSYYRGAHFILVSYSIDQRDSFQRVTDYIEEAKRFGSAGVQFVILGTKQDLEEKREVSEDEGRALADFHGARYLATSSKTRQGIDELRRLLEQLTASMGAAPAPPVRAPVAIKGTANAAAA